MGFSIDYGSGTLGAIAIVLMISAAAIALVFFISAANRARHDVVDDDPDMPER